jgi:hypothetical protein
MLMQPGQHAVFVRVQDTALQQQQGVCGVPHELLAPGQVARLGASLL